MNDIFYLGHYIKNIEGKEYFCIRVLDLKHFQIFTFYHTTDEKSKNIINSFKKFDNITDKLTYVIKRNNKISFDLK